MQAEPQSCNVRENYTTDPIRLYGRPLPVWLTNAVYNPWKAGLTCGTEISEPKTLRGVERKEGFDSGSHQRTLCRAISAFVSIIQY